LKSGSSATADKDPAGNVIAPSSNEIRYRATDPRTVETDKTPKIIRFGQIQAHFFRGHSRTVAKVSALGVVGLLDRAPMTSGRQWRLTP
jgi:hypothetical protein